MLERLPDESDKDYEKRLAKSEAEKEKLMEKFKLKRGSEYRNIQLNLGAIQTGIFKLDPAIGFEGNDGVVGIAARDIVEIMGLPASGKSAIAMEVVKTNTKRFGPFSCVWVSSEPIYPTLEMCRLKGMDEDDVIFKSVYDPDVELKKNLAEDQLEDTLRLAELDSTKVIIIDSVAALLTASQLYGKGSSYRDVESSPVAALSKVFSNFCLQFMRRNKNATLFLVNHWKPGINIDSKYIIGAEHWTSAGRMKEFLSNVRLLVSGMLDRDRDKHSVEDSVSSNTLKSRIEIFKNKYCNVTNNRVLTNIQYDFIEQRYNNEDALLDWASFFGTRVPDPNNPKVKITESTLDPPVASAGAYTYLGDRSFNGRHNAVQYLIDNPAIYDKLKNQLYKKEYRDKFFLDEKPDPLKDLDG